MTLPLRGREGGSKNGIKGYFQGLTEATGGEGGQKPRKLRRCCLWMVPKNKDFPPYLGFLYML